MEPRGDGGHRFTLVLLHSCSGGPDDWIPIFHRLRLSFRNNVRVVIPCAPVRREEHGGWIGEMNSWFEYAEDGQRSRHPSQVLDQRARLLQLLEQERARLPGGDARRLVLGGLSQGVALAVDVALRTPFSVGGVVALRGMVLPESLDSLPRDRGPPLRLFAYHGERDSQCPVDEAREGYELLRPHGVSVRFVSDPELGHACARGRQRLCGAELRQTSAFLEEVWSAVEGGDGAGKCRAEEDGVGATRLHRRRQPPSEGSAA